MNLQQKLYKDETDARLENWRAWGRHDDTYAKLGYSKQPISSVIASKGRMVAALDAFYIDWLISTLWMTGYDLAMRHSFVLKVEYERNTEEVPHVSQRSKDVRRKLKQPCADSTYYKYLKEAKRAIRLLAEPIK